jgi:NAD(P)-dependent dehydrogenase (short-subunit alcohol dehydrogenase family)
MGQLEKKVCLITGGAGSIGIETAKLFLDEGASVLLVDLDADKLEAATGGLDRRRVGYAVADVSRAADVQAYVVKACGRFGKIDVLFSNAGAPGHLSLISAVAPRIPTRSTTVGPMPCRASTAARTEGGALVRSMPLAQRLV